MPSIKGSSPVTFRVAGQQDFALTPTLSLKGEGVKRPERELK
jgi:hypothetical protein